MVKNGFDIKNIIVLCVFGMLCAAAGYLFGADRNPALAEITDELAGSQEKQRNNLDRIDRVQSGIAGSEDKLRTNDSILNECQRIVAELLQRAEEKNQ